MRDKRNSSLSPKKGFVLSLSTEQSIPIGAATDLGTADSVTGNPAGARNKPGNGFGYD